MLKFNKIGDLNINETNSWEGENCFLTFDVDWAPDEVLSYTIDIIEKFDIKATWFITHDTPLIDRLRSNKKFELGIHPNFNPLLLHGNGDKAGTIIKRFQRMVPEAKSIRTHGLVQGFYLSKLYANHGLSYECNCFIPHDSKIKLSAWKDSNGLVQVPHFFEDDVEFSARNFKNSHEKTLTKKYIELFNRQGLKVFDFHPIHVYLNTAEAASYEQFKKRPEDIDLLVNKSFGTRDILLALLSYKDDKQM